MLLCTFLVFFVNFIIKLVFLSFLSIFLMKYQISGTEYQPFRNRDWLSEIVSETIC